jgi:hypothetical protein
MEMYLQQEIREKNLEKMVFGWYRILKVNDENISQRYETGSVPKWHGSAIMLSSNTSDLQFFTAFFPDHDLDLKLKPDPGSGVFNTHRKN